MPTEPATLADLEQLVRLVGRIRNWKSLSFKTRRRSDHAQRSHQTELFSHRIDPLILAHALRPLARRRRNGRRRAATYSPTMAWSMRSGKRRRLSTSTRTLSLHLPPDATSLTRFVNLWMSLQASDGFHDRQVAYWLQGKARLSGAPRWNLLDNVIRPALAGAPPGKR